jgi:CRISPR-associated protein Csx17
MNDLVLEGCAPSVLASYLKALAVHRLVAEQLDREARSYWDGDGRFHLVSSAGWDELVTFFVHQYKPSPIVTPWNGGSGFHPGDQRAGIDAIRSSTDPRFEPYRRVIAATERLLTSMRITEKPEKELKQRLLERARSWLPEEVLPWLDAAYAVSETPGFSAVLGTGGNDGRLEFANNFMQRLAEMFLAPAKGARQRVNNADRVDAALFGRARPQVNAGAPFGQFSPARAGGANMGEGLNGGTRVNPWDYVFAIEGTLTFAGATVRRLDSAGDRAAAFPFHVATSAVGYGSSASSDEDNARSELWLPLWSQPASHEEVRNFFSEGRLQVGQHRAHDGLEAARAVASLGVDRGIDRFQRIGIFKRNGLAFLATSQGTLHVQAIPRVMLLEEPYEHARRVERVKEASPGVSAALRRLQSAMFEACRHRDRKLTDTLAALGALEHAIARSPKTMSAPYLRSLRHLSSEWLTEADDGSSEFALAASFASWEPRAELLPLDARGNWDANVKTRWPHGDPLGGLVALARRRLVRGGHSAFASLAGRGHPRTPAALGALCDGTLDLARFEDLLFGLALTSPRVATRPLSMNGEGASHADERSDATLHVLRAVVTPTLVSHTSHEDVLAILGALASRNAGRAVEVATRRLRASGWRPLAPVRVVHLGDPNAYAAALLVPMPRTVATRLTQRSLRPLDNPRETARIESAHERNE